MRSIKIPGAGIVFPFGSDEEISRQQRIIDRRWAFVKKYMKKKGWDAEHLADLSVDQITEIRSQQEWIDAKNEP